MLYSDYKDPPMEPTPRTFSIVCNWGNFTLCLKKDILRAHAMNPGTQFHVLTPGCFQEVEEYMRKLGVSPAAITYYGKHESKYKSKVVCCGIEQAIDLITKETTHDLGDGKSIWFRIANIRASLPPYIPMRIQLVKK